MQKYASVTRVKYCLLEPCAPMMRRRDYMHTASLGRRDGSSQHKSLHQARAFRRGLDVVTSAEISPSRLLNDAVCIILYEYLFETTKSSGAVKRFGESGRWADLTIRLVVEANSMSARNSPLGYERVYLPLCIVADTPLHIQGEGA